MADRASRPVVLNNMEDSTTSIIQLILTIIQTVIIAGGAIWAYFRFFKEGAHQPRIEFDIECTFMGPQEGRYVAAFLVHAKNQGNIEHKFPEIRLRVRGIKSDTKLSAWAGREPLLSFPEEEFETVNIIPEKYKYFFVRPGVHQKFSFVTSVPASWRFVIVRASFKYETSKELHIAERAFEIKRE